MSELLHIVDSIGTRRGGDKRSSDLLRVFAHNRAYTTSPFPSLKLLDFGQVVGFGLQGCVKPPDPRPGRKARGSFLPLRCVLAS